jgi:hypothetical protein
MGGQCQAVVALPPAKRPGTQHTGGWVGLGAGLDGFGKSVNIDIIWVCI